MARSLLDIFGEVSIVDTQRAEMQKGAFRLDASFYSERSRDVAEAIADSGLRVDTLGSIAEVFCSNVRERTFARPSHGYPLLTGSDLDTTNDDDLRYVSKLFTRSYQIEKLSAGDSLLSSAGTVGKCDFVWKNHEGKLASQDIVRVRPDPEKISAAYLNAVLRSPIGQALISNYSAGSVIVRLYSEQLDGIDIPRLKKSIEESISAKVYASYDSRAESRKLMEVATQQTATANELPGIRREESEEPECFSLPNQDLYTPENEFRIEAHFHNPTATRVVQSIHSCRSVKKTLGDLSRDVVLETRFKRNYVEASFGTPFLSGKNIIQLRPEMKFLSNTQTEGLDKSLLQRAWILVTRSGTIGRICFVWKNFEGFAASEHVLRVIPREDQVDPGYLCAFLTSEYGYEQVIRFRHGSVIDEISAEQLKKVVVPLPSASQQREIGNTVRLAYEKRAEAIRLESEAQVILMREFKGRSTKEN